MELLFTLLVVVCLTLSHHVQPCHGLQSFLPKFNFPEFGAVTKSTNKNNNPAATAAAARAVEDELLEAIRDGGNRLANSDRILNLIEQLETSEPFRKVSIAEPAIAPQVYGRWRLLYTTNADTSSPIQRKAVDTQQFPIYQDIVLVDKKSDNKKDNNDSNDKLLLVKQIVQFSDSAELSVDALASTAAYPLAELTGERKSTGKVFGLNVLGVSLVGTEAAEDPNRPNARINFVFDEGNFLWNNGVKIPYPVPFRFPLLRDWVKGWIDITWLSDRVRISRGNKGTTFVLVKEDDDEPAKAKKEEKQ